MTFSVEAEKSSFEKVSEFAEELTDKIMADESLIYKNDIEVIEVSVVEVEDHNDYDGDDEDYLDDEEEDY
jgi:hypothetical protein